MPFDRLTPAVSQRKYSVVKHLPDYRVRNALKPKIHIQKHTRGEGVPQSMTVQICKHQFSDRTTCEAVALRNHHYCMWHRTEADRRRRTHRFVRQSRHRRISLTVSTHPNIVQHNIQQVIDAMLSDRISNKRAGVLLYAIANTIYS